MSLFDIKPCQHRGGGGASSSKGFKIKLSLQAGGGAGRSPQTPSSPAPALPTSFLQAPPSPTLSSPLPKGRPGWGTPAWQELALPPRPSMPQAAFLHFLCQRGDFPHAPHPPAKCWRQGGCEQSHTLAPMHAWACVCVYATLLPASVNLQVQHPWGCTQTLCVRWQHHALPAPALAGPEGCRCPSSSSSQLLPPGTVLVTPEKSVTSSIFPAPL